MKGVILAGGNATRLRPLTLVTNKHLLPIYNKPMIFYPLESMARAGIKDVLIITSPNHAGSFLNLLGSGKDFGLKLNFSIQEEANGLASAVGLAKDFADDDDNLLVILGDNIFKYDLSSVVKDFEKENKGAKVFAVKNETPEHYGVVELEGNKVLSIEEKPKKPKSNFIMAGIYMYDSNVFTYVKTLTPSDRGEFEITDLNNIYLKKNAITCEIMDDIWIDAGTSHEELLRANMLVKKYFSS
jgi:glucose-1-phosphate thymidylyltransferase